MAFLGKWLYQEQYDTGNVLYSLKFSKLPSYIVNLNVFVTLILCWWPVSAIESWLSDGYISQLCGIN